MLPDRTIAVKTDVKKTLGFKQEKNRLTLLLACNGSGAHKLKHLTIGRLKSPGCFDSVNQQNLPLIYRNSARAWMIASLFEEWFFQFFVPDQNLPEKVIGLLDNSAAHPQYDVLQTTDGQIKVLYLPKNTTSKIQLCDARIIHPFKSVYKKEHIEEMLDSPFNVTEYLKQLMIKGAIYISGRAPDAVTTKNIGKYLNKNLGAAFPRSGDIEEEVDIWLNVEQMVATQEQLGSSVLFEEKIILHDWVNDWERADDEISETEMLTDSEIVEQISHEIY
ncbi:Jerky protein -like protein [Thelohanellus kitauei]|uniref:Jerky protein-like protein n=1 Tax=Thelohanellus kitauei TaxID=669202 RepID=A0A0C2I7R4_THEKT|nr:Jerky protein -like protein [Thelohanellus kitauei]